MEKIKRKLKDIGIQLELMDLEGNGYFEKRFRIMFVNINLDEDSIKRVIYHELKHALDHVEFAKLYNSTVYHSKMEHEANMYMVDSVIAENDGYYNYSQLIEEFDLGMGYDVLFAK